MTTTSAPTKNTQAFMYQAAISFGVAVLFTAIAICYLPLDPWPRACLGLAMLFLVTSSFTLAKVVRDQQESGRVISRLDEVRLERLLAQYDPYKLTDFEAPKVTMPTRPETGPTPMPMPVPTATPAPAPIPPLHSSGSTRY
jgi:hypothetical protein